MKNIKDGVEIECMTIHNLQGIILCTEEFTRRGLNIVITSLTDGKHKSNSKHYSGNAFDVRIWNIPTPELLSLVDALRAILGENYDVILEETHIHVEFDPK